MEFNQTAYYKTPIGIAKIMGNEDGISSISILDEVENFPIEIPTYLKECVQQLEEYFKGSRTEFNLKLNPKGTEFQQKVWDDLQNVSFGTTKTYSEQAIKLGDIKAIRAVAAANGKPPPDVHTFLPVRHSVSRRPWPQSPYQARASSLPPAYRWPSHHLAQSA